MHTTILPIVAHKLKGTASYKCVWKLFLPFSLSKRIGRTPYIIDLPYPVGRDTKVSLQDTNAQWLLFASASMHAVPSHKWYLLRPVSV